MDSEKCEVTENVLIQQEDATTTSSMTAKEATRADTTFQLDEDTAVGDVGADTPVQVDVDSPSELLKSKQKKRPRRKRLSESLSQPRFADNYRCSQDAFLGCGSYGSVYTCSSLRSSYSAAANQKGRSSSQNRGAKKDPRHRCTLLGIETSEQAREGEFSEEDEEEEVEEVSPPRKEDEFAVKIIDKKGHSRTRLFNEMEIMHVCKNHANIVQLLDFYEEEDSFFLIFEKMHGGPLLDHLSESGPVSERDASLVTRDLASALEFLHSEGIAHRDLKPANILCTYRHSIAPVKICDFDLASAPWTRDQDESRQRRLRAAGARVGSSPEDEQFMDLVSPVGSAEYMAPEVVSVFLCGNTAPAYDKRCDLWSLGVILYIMLCGYPPFIGRCGYPCGWEQGHSCVECQSLLMEAIQEADLFFPDQDWDHITDDAVDLVCCLLERNIQRRIPAHFVNKHPWMVYNIAAAEREAEEGAEDDVNKDGGGDKESTTSVDEKTLLSENGLMDPPPPTGEDVCATGSSTPSQPIPMTPIQHNKLRKSSGSSNGSSKQQQQQKLRYKSGGGGSNAVSTLNSQLNGLEISSASERTAAANFTAHERLASPPIRIEHTQNARPPLERHRLGTEDSGFDGEGTSGSVGMRDFFNKHPSSGMSGTFRSGHSKKLSSGDHQFEISDDESLFSSGYGMSLDLPAGELWSETMPCPVLGDVYGEGKYSMGDPYSFDIPKSDSEDFGFESIDHSELESAMMQQQLEEDMRNSRGGFQQGCEGDMTAALDSGAGDATTRNKLGLLSMRNRHVSSRMSSNASSRNTVLNENTSDVNGNMSSNVTGPQPELELTNDDTTGEVKEGSAGSDTSTVSN